MGRREKKQDEMEKVSYLIVQSEESCRGCGAQPLVLGPRVPTGFLTPRDNPSLGLGRVTALPELRHPEVPSGSFKERSTARNQGESDCAEFKAKQGKGGEDGRESSLSLSLSLSLTPAFIFKEKLLVKTKIPRKS